MSLLQKSRTGWRHYRYGCINQRNSWRRQDTEEDDTDDGEYIHKNRRLVKGRPSLSFIQIDSFIGKNTNFSQMPIKTLILCHQQSGMKAHTCFFS